LYLNLLFESDTNIIHYIISGSYYRSASDSIYNKGDQSTFGELSYTVVDSDKRNKYAYTFFAYYGEFDVNFFEKESSLNGTYSYGGLGAMFDYTNVLPNTSENIEVRPIGIRVSTLAEYGEFFNFRDSNLYIGNNLSFTNINPLGFSFTFGLTNELIIRSKKNEYGFFHTLGYTALMNCHYGLSLYTRFNDLLYLSLEYNTHAYGQGMLGLSCNFVVK